MFTNIKKVICMDEKNILNINITNLTSNTYQKDKIKFDCITGKGERSKQEDTSFMYNIELYVNNKTYNI